MDASHFHGDGSHSFHCDRDVVCGSHFCGGGGGEIGFDDDQLQNSDTKRHDHI